jgi:hypothetical protein
MDLFYIYLFIVFAFPAALLELKLWGITDTTQQPLQGGDHARFKRFRNNYVLVFSLMMGKPELRCRSLALWTPCWCFLDQQPTQPSQQMNAA